MTAAALNVKLNIKNVDFEAKEHLQPEFLKINPQHTVPTLIDNGFILWESRAICLYLIEKYGKDNSLLPKEPKTQAVINQRLQFDLGTLYKPLGDYYFAAFYGIVANPEDFKKLQNAVELLNTFLENTGFVAGTQALSIADLVIFSTVGVLEVAKFDLTPYPRVQKWLKMMKETAPGKEKLQETVDILKNFL